jgi:LmbE family N-acetylglucosaminyl deacetylase
VSDKLRLMCVLAHPDDESLGFGGTLARYAAEGVETYLVTATRGERGWFGDEKDNPGPEALGKIREAELRAATNVLGVGGLSFLDYVDGDLDRANPDEAVEKIASQIRKVRPQVIATFGPDGGYGHPDHIAICQLTTAAIMRATGGEHSQGSTDTPEPHCVSKLYYLVSPVKEVTMYQAIFGDLVMNIDGIERRANAWPDWAITTRVHSEEYWSTVWRAVSCHRSQLPGYGSMINLPEEKHRALWGEQQYYRAFSLVNGGRTLETDLFEGLR